MFNLDRRQILSLFIATAGCVAGSYSAYAAFSTGQMLTGGFAAILVGLAFAAVVVISWLMLPWADMRAAEGAKRDAWAWRFGWLLALGFVLANSIVYSAQYRIQSVDAKGVLIDAYSRAERAENLASQELQTLRKNPRWDATSGCSNATAAKSIEFCKRVSDAQSRRHEAQGVLAQGRPAAKDAGAQTLAWAMSADENKIGRSLPIFWAVVLELIASLCMKDAFANLKRPMRDKDSEAPQAANDHFRFEPYRGHEQFRGATPIFYPAGQSYPTAQGYPIRQFAFAAAIDLPVCACNDNMPAVAYA